MSPENENENECFSIETLVGEFRGILLIEKPAQTCILAFDLEANQSTRFQRFPLARDIQPRLYDCAGKKGKMYVPSSEKSLTGLPFPRDSIRG
jgi:hypothetical protein